MQASLSTESCRYAQVFERQKFADWDTGFTTAFDYSATVDYGDTGMDAVEVGTDRR